MILRPIGPSLRRDEVGEGGDADGDPAFVGVRRGASIQFVVAEPDALVVGHVVEDVERPGIGHQVVISLRPKNSADGKWRVT